VRILIDTNVLIAAFIVHGACAELLEHCGRNHTLVTSDYILDELKKTLISKFHYSASEAAHAADIIRIKSTVYPPANVPAAACEDPDDLPILGSAVSGKCQCIITGDKALLKISSYQNIDIISPGDFWKYEAQTHQV
jgi:putative PIN family toxin of toxin-antitoxin system